MTGKEAISWLQQQTNIDINEIINVNYVSKLKNLEMASYNGYWSIENMDNYEVIIDEEVFNNIVEMHNKNFRK